MRKRVSILSLFIIVSSFIFAQNTVKDKDRHSIFANFDQLGIKKEFFIDQFGNPTSKDMVYDQEKNKIETLYYKEDFTKDYFIIITALTFKNNELIEQKSRIETFVIDRKTIDKISDDLTFIRRWTQ